MIPLLLACVLTSFQDPAKEAKEAVDALIALKEGDEEGRDLQTDRLLKLGEKALDEIEKRMETAKGAGAYRLRCVRDMIWYPIDIKGAYANTPSNPRMAAALHLEVGDIYLSFNGQRVNGHMELHQALHKAERDGLTEVVVEILQKGRHRTVKIPGLRTGGTIKDYPHDLAVYVHRGHRGPAWDDLVFEGIDPGREQRLSFTTQKLTSAIRAGCRDVLILMRAMWGQMEHGRPEEARALWDLCRGALRTTGQSAEVQADCWYIASRAFLECGDAEAAMSLAQESEKRMDGPGFAVHRAFQKGYQGLLLQEQDLGRATDMLRGAVEDQRNLKNSNIWLQSALLNVLKRQSRWDECFRLRWIYDDYNFMGYDPAPCRDSMRLMGEYDRPARVLIPRRALYSGGEAAGRGTGKGLNAEYFANETLEGTPLRRVDPQVNFDWGLGSPHPSIPSDHFSARWTGKLEPEFTGLHTFTTRTDDGVRLWVDGTLLIDHWVGQAPTEWSGTIDLKAGEKVDLKMEYFEGGVGAVAQLFWSPPPATRPKSWALVYRQNFEVPGAALSYFEGPVPSEENGSRVAAGRLVVSESDVSGFERSWNVYDDVRIEADIHLLWDLKEETYRGAHVGLSTCINSARKSEAGSAFGWPRDFQSTLYGSNATFSYQPRIDLRKTHRLSLEVFQGKLVTKVDGKWVNTQVLPAGWSGSCGLEQDSMPYECDNLEIFVPDSEPGDETGVRALYDKAAADFNSGRLDDALGDLEQAAVLQPRNDDLGRLYASYLLAAKRGRTDLRKRLEKAGPLRLVEMLLEAEVQLDLLAAAPESAALYRAVHRRTLEGQASSEKDLAGLAESSLPGPLVLYIEDLRARVDRGAAGVDEVLGAFQRALGNAPDSPVLAYRFVRFCVDQGRAEVAQPSLQNLLKAIPHASFLKEWIREKPH